MGQDRDIAFIVQRLKERALASPWVPVGVPPQQHYHIFPNGLSICFTLDILPAARYWHLSIARMSSGPTAEEVEFWPRAFFEELPTVEVPFQIWELSSKHFHWRAE